RTRSRASSASFLGSASGVTSLIAATLATAGFHFSTSIRAFAFPVSADSWWVRGGYGRLRSDRERRPEGRSRGGDQGRQPDRRARAAPQEPARGPEGVRRDGRVERRGPVDHHGGALRHVAQGRVRERRLAGGPPPPRPRRRA